MFLNNKIRLSRRLRQYKVSRFTVFKTLFGIVVVTTFVGYQPPFVIPRIKPVLAQGPLSEGQNIDASSLPFSFTLPHVGYISTHFSSWHPAIDIATSLGTPIHPIAPGRVEAVYFDVWGLGHHVVISHPEGFESTYGHMGQVFVKVGDQVTPDSIIGQVGLTGNTTGPHTHLEIKLNGNYVDPETLLPHLPDIPTASAYPKITEPIIPTQTNTDFPEKDLTANKPQDNLTVSQELIFNL